MRGQTAGGLTLERRGKTSLELLQIDWVHPVWKPREPGPGATVVREVERALPRAEAYRLAAGDDPRPLLVLRECERCKGTDHALLSDSFDNEQTLLLTRWFRCVKLPTHVLEDQHPFHALFEASQPGALVPHLFVCDPDGGNRADLPGDQSQAELWSAMYASLERCYRGDARKAIKELRALLGKFDRLDHLEADLRSRIDREIERNGLGSQRLDGYEVDLKKLTREREELLAREKQLRALARKELGRTGTAPAAGAPQ